MDDRQDDRFKMIRKVEDFFQEFNADLVGYPHIIDVHNRLTALREKVVDHTVTATRDISGYTEAKEKQRGLLESKMLLVSLALAGYFRAQGQPYEQALAETGVRILVSTKEGDLYVAANDLFLSAEPVKALLSTYGAQSADVEELETLSIAYLRSLQTQRRENKKSQTATKLVGSTLKKALQLLSEELDTYMAPFASTAVMLHTRYRMARKIDKSRHGRG